MTEAIGRLHAHRSTSIVALSMHDGGRRGGDDARAIAEVPAERGELRADARDRLDRPDRLLAAVARRIQLQADGVEQVVERPPCDRLARRKTGVTVNAFETEAERQAAVFELHAAVFEARL